MKVAMYCRVSTLDQSIDMQRADLIRYCVQHGHLYEEYSDAGISGSRPARPALDRLMADAKKRKFEAVLVWRFDRFARSTRHLLTALEEFRHHEIDFISYSENIDTSSPLGEAMFTIVAAVAQLERDIIRERTRGGIRRAKEKGKRLGRPPIDPYKIAEIRRYRFGYGYSLSVLAKRFGIGRSTVHKICHAKPDEKLNNSILQSA